MESKYPEQERRRNMLVAVREWLQGRTDLRTWLRYDDIANLVDSPVYSTPEDSTYDYQELTKHMDAQIALFQSLVRQGYIDAELKGGSKTGPPFSFALVYDLTDKGHHLIDTLPDPKEELYKRLDAIEEAIWALQDPEVSQDQKEEAVRAVGVLKQLGVGVSSNGAYDLVRGLLSSL